MTEAGLLIDIVTIFPEYFSPLELSLIGRARRDGLAQIKLYDLRSWTSDVHRTVDDSPYGGGPGMVMRPEPWGLALDELVATDDDQAPPTVVITTPAGAPFNQAIAADLAQAGHLIFVCGRYEGIDQRVAEYAARRAQVRELSIGDYVLFGGEAAALVMLEAIIRLVPGVLGNAGSLELESHSDGLLEAEVYTKPGHWRGLSVPEILLSGDHARIAAWRREQGLLRTANNRPDLLASLPPGTLSGRDLVFLATRGLIGEDSLKASDS